MMNNQGLKQELRHRLVGVSLTYPVLVLSSLSARLVAYALSARTPAGFVEMNPVANPGSLSSIALSECGVLAGSLLVLFLFGNPAQRNIVQSFFAALLIGDATNDIVLMVTSVEYLAMLVSYAVTATIPTVVGLQSMR